MGLFNRFKKDKNREKVEKEAEKLKKQLKDKNLAKISIGGKESNIKIDVNQMVDDAIIDNYGTDKEKAGLNERRENERLEKLEYQKLNEKYLKARRMNDSNSIIIYRELIEEAYKYPKLISMCYMGIVDAYTHFRKYDKAFDTLNESIKFKKQNGMDYEYDLTKLQRIQRYAYDMKLTQLQKNGESLCGQSEYDEALITLKEATDLGSTRYQTFKCLAECYIVKRELDSALNILNIGIERIEKENSNTMGFSLHNERNDGLKDILENVNHKIETGKFKWDCLPYDDPSNKPKIKEAKALLKDGDKKKGVELLEEIMTNGTFDNTVYNTLYQTYKKDKKYDDCIRVCEKAIDVLGFFSNDRLERWTINLEKVIKQQEKK